MEISSKYHHLQTSPKYGVQVKEKGSDKTKANQRPASKEQTKPVEVKLHTQQRAARRAGFNYLVAYKTSLMEQQRREIERIQKLIEDEEIRMLRKEMIPKAQLMPFFDRPFFPQRSTRPLTVPREPSFMSSKCWRSSTINDPQYFQQLANASRKAIK